MQKKRKEMAVRTVCAHIFLITHFSNAIFRRFPFHNFLSEQIPWMLCICLFIHYFFLCFFLLDGIFFPVPCYDRFSQRNFTRFRVSLSLFLSRTLFVLVHVAVGGNLHCVTLGGRSFLVLRKRCIAFSLIFHLGILNICIFCANALPFNIKLKVQVLLKSSVAYLHAPKTNWSVRTKFRCSEICVCVYAVDSKILQTINSKWTIPFA